MGALGSVTGRVARRYGAKAALVFASAVTAVAFVWSAIQHAHPYDILISCALMGIGMGFAFAALGNLIVGALQPHQTGVASGMNTVMRTLGGALGGQISATFIADNVLHGLPTVAGFTESYWMATGFLIVAAIAGLLVPTGRAAVPQPPMAEPELAGVASGR